MGGAAPAPNPQPIDSGPLALVQPAPFLPTMSPSQMPDGSTAVVLRYETVTGSVVLFLTPDQAMDHGRALVKCGREATTGLVLPRGGLLTP